MYGMNGWCKNSGDCISRQAAIDAIRKYDFFFPQYMEWFVIELSNAMKSDLVNDIKALPAAQSQRMKGKWVEVTDGTCIWKVCDQCGEKPLWNEWKTDRCESDFCPNCGSYNGGEQDG